MYLSIVTVVVPHENPTELDVVRAAALESLPSLA